MDSLQTRFTAWLVGPALIAIIAGACLSYTSASREIDRLSNERLAWLANTIAATLAYDRGEVAFSVPSTVLDALMNGNTSQSIYSVYDPEGRIIGGRLGFQPPSDTPKFRSRFFRIVLGGVPLRAVTLRHRVEFPGGNRYVAVVVGEPVEVYDEVFQSIWLRMLAQQTFLILAAASMAWVGISSEMRPIGKLKKAFSARSEVVFEPIDTTALRAELRPAVEAYNDNMKWLGQLRRQRRFLESAAHQLRTPLAIMKTQVGHVRRNGTQQEVADTLRQVDESLSSMARLTSQLLMLGKVEHEQATQQLEPVDLIAIARNAIGEAIPKGLDHGVELVFDPGSDCLVMANATLIRELVRNLVDNAVNYAGSGAIAVVSVHASGPEALLKVDDDGVGVDEVDRARLTGRFTRVGKNSREGSGLGLSIVAEIAEIYGGALELPLPRRGHGFCAVVRFPLALETRPHDSMTSTT